MVSRRAIQKFADDVARRFKPEKIILFGSYAYGKPTPDSDVDLLVVMRYDRRKGRMSLRILEAENDFTVVSQILRRRKDRVPDAACFFCQQCVEKYLKARMAG